MWLSHIRTSPTPSLAHARRLIAPVPALTRTDGLDWPIGQALCAWRCFYHKIVVGFSTDNLLLHMGLERYPSESGLEKVLGFAIFRGWEKIEKTSKHMLLATV